MMFKGIFPPIPTPFDRKENIDFNALKFNIQKWNNTDLSGLVVLGSNGEFVYLSREEKERLICFTRSPLEIWANYRKREPSFFSKQHIDPLNFEKYIHFH